MWRPSSRPVTMEPIECRRGLSPQLAIAHRLIALSLAGGASIGAAIAAPLS